MASAVKFVPKFDEANIEHYFVSFEKAMNIHKFPRDKWTALLHPQLTGKAQQVFSELSLEGCKNYDTLKQALLTAFARVPEFYWKRFRSLVKGPQETFSAFAFRLALPFQRWLEGEDALNDLPKVLEVFKLEQFVNCLPVEIHRWIIDKKPSSLAQASKLADEIAILYKPFPAHASVLRPNEEKRENFGFGRDSSRGAKAPWSPRNFRKEGQFQFHRSFDQQICTYCSKPGHGITSCFQLHPELKAKRDLSTHKNATPRNVELVAGVGSFMQVKDGPTKMVDAGYLSFCTSGSVYAPTGLSRNIVVLRDTGSLQSLASKTVLHTNEYCDTGEVRLIRGISGVTLQVPLVEVVIDSKFANGTILCGLVDHLPTGIHILIGNDLDSSPEEINVGVTTRAQAKLIDSDTSLVAHAKPVDDKSVDVDSQLDVDLNDLFNESTVVHADLTNVVSRENLISMQQADASLRPLFQLVEQRDGQSVTRQSYSINNGILVRLWKDVDTPDELGYLQIVVPSQLRTKLLYIAHDIPASGHLGVKKTLDRLLRHFYWPGINSSVRTYCRTCDVCQRLGKGASSSRAPLINLPIIAEPFSRLAIDIVGPLSVCDGSHNRFILTVIDLATHYPFAFPLRNHTAHDVAKCLISVFTMFGFPKEILSDCGTEFMSELMQVFLHECNVIQLKSSPYHPQTNGSCEKFNRTLKDMLKAIVEDFPSSWDQILPWVLFAYREVPVQGLGFSSFDLVFGRCVNGPLRLIKQSWLSDDVLSGVEKTNLVDFVLKLRERIRVSVRLANENAVVAKSKSKEWYDRCAKVVDFEVGQQVLLLLPLIGKPLEAKYAGPYVVLERLGLVDYLVATPDRRKSKRVVHVNLMRKYESRVDCVPSIDVGLVVPACVNVNVSESPTLEEVVGNSPLDCVQRDELLDLLGTF